MKTMKNIIVVLLTLLLVSACNATPTPVKTHRVAGQITDVYLAKNIMLFTVTGAAGSRVFRCKCNELSWRGARGLGVGSNVLVEYQVVGQSCNVTEISLLPADLWKTPKPATAGSEFLQTIKSVRLVYDSE